MDSISLDLKVEELWEDHLLNLTKLKRALYLKAVLIKENFLFVIGLPDLLMNQEAKMIPSLSSGIKKETSGLYYLLTCSHAMRISF